MGVAQLRNTPATSLIRWRVSSRGSTERQDVVEDTVPGPGG
jgi:hypothetical protein